MSINKIALLSPPIGNGNLGDEAIVAACIQGIRRHHPGASIYVISPNPADTRRRHKVDAYPIRWMADPERRAPITVPVVPLDTADGSDRRSVWHRTKALVKRLPWVHKLLKGMLSVPRTTLYWIRQATFLIPSWKQLRRVDLLMMAGSGALCDHFGGALNFPLTVFEWSLLAKLAGVPFAFASVGAGPVYSRVSRVLFGLSLRWASYRSVREVTSQEIFRDLLKIENTPVLPDLAHGLEVSSTGPPLEHGSHLLVGINPFPHFDPRFWPQGEPERYERYLDVLAEFTVWLIDNGHRAFLFPTQIRADRKVIADLEDLIIKDVGNSARWLGERPINDVDDLTSALAATDVVVAGRFHGILLAFLMNRPVIGIGNHHKMSDLMQSMGQGRYSLDADSITRDMLVDRFLRIAADRDAASREIAARVEVFREALDLQYQQILDPDQHEREAESGVFQR